MSTATAEFLSVVLLVAVLACAVLRPRGIPEIVVAGPAAIVLIVTGAISLRHAIDETTRLAPVVGFLAAILVLAQLCNAEGLFHAAGTLMARTCAGSPQRLLVLVFGTAAATTAVLSLDATVVLLTPVVFATAARLGARAKPHVYASTHLANSASLLFPVSNLTNLLAFTTAGITFVHFTALMALPWFVAIGVEYLVFRYFFAADLAAGADKTPVVTQREVPVFTLTVLGLTLVGFVLTSFVGIEPVWTASVGAAVLACRALAQRRITPAGIVRSAGIPFLLFVLALGIVVRAVVDNGLADAVGHLLPDGSSLSALLALAAVAAVLANLINNLPAVLVLLPLVAGGGVGQVLAVLIGVNIGPNLTYAGSLATLLWRRVLRDHDAEPRIGEFTKLGLLTVPACLVLAVVGLWLSLQVFGA
ncbi:arsenic transporter [Antrihabitans cavernicola]|uniref:Arsenic transporter n=1 Tax=Antrihabitans cavernicola TaxID=2495913 RepID=A0A5A7SDS4_9NOCA|nr:arsenic transporter [Spelaeibacter cavernicola]